jgi:hypothetical protein
MGGRGESAYRNHGSPARFLWESNRRMKMREAQKASARPPTTAAQLAGAHPSSFLGLIIKDVTDVTVSLLNKVKMDTGKGANTSMVLSELFMWNWIKKYAESKYDKLLDSAKESGLLESPGTEPGTSVIAESRHFVVTANVTEPVQRFSPEALAKWAFEEYKIPVIVMKEQIEKAKVPTKPMVRVSIAERA